MQSVLDVHLKRGAELLTDHRLMVCHLCLKKNRAYAYVQDYEVLLNKVGGPAAQGCKKYLCRQRIVYIPRDSRMHSRREGGVAARQSNCSSIRWSHMRHVTNLGHQGGGEGFSEVGPNFLNYVQYLWTMSKTFFQGGGQKNFHGDFAPCTPTLVMGL